MNPGFHVPHGLVRACFALMTLAMVAAAQAERPPQRVIVKLGVGR